MPCPFVLLDFHFHFQAEELEPLGIQELIDTIKANSFQPKREAAGQFILAVDHCFPIRGQGTVMTGTVLNGAVNINDVSKCIAWFMFIQILSFVLPLSLTARSCDINACDASLAV